MQEIFIIEILLADRKEDIDRNTTVGNFTTSFTLVDR